MIIKCWLGFHNYEVVELEDILGSAETGNTDIPSCEWVVGGMDYHIKCSRCNKSFIVSGRGAWVEPKYPKSRDCKRTKSSGCEY